jgi:hypothetical protein
MPEALAPGCGFPSVGWTLKADKARRWRISNERKPQPKKEAIMFKEHPSFVQPENEDIRVWRYMSFTKLVSLLESSCLFFTRADKLGDPFEGSWPKINVAARFEIPNDIPEESRPAFLEATKNLSKVFKNMPKAIALNCWHMNEHESAAMWKLYLESNEGIAVQSTYKRLRDSLMDEEEIYMGIVKYIDYQTEWIDARNLMSPFMHKRKSYEHEKEVRALVLKLPVVEKHMNFSKETIIDGLRIKVNMEALAERIYVAPYSPGWFEELVRSVVTKYSYDFEIKHSGLDELPLF